MNARSIGPADAGSCFAIVGRNKRKYQNAALGRVLPDTVDLGMGSDLNTSLTPVTGLIASSVGLSEGRAGLRPSIALHIGGAKTCPRQIVSSDVLPGRPVVLYTKADKKKKKMTGSVGASDGNPDNHTVFGTCISGGKQDSSIDVVLGGQYNVYVRGHKSYYNKFLK